MRTDWKSFRKVMNEPVSLHYSTANSTWQVVAEIECRRQLVMKASIAWFKPDRKCKAWWTAGIGRLKKVLAGTRCVYRAKKGRRRCEQRKDKRRLVEGQPWGSRSGPSGKRPFRVWTGIRPFQGSESDTGGGQCSRCKKNKVATHSRKNARSSRSRPSPLM